MASIRLAISSDVDGIAHVHINSWMTTYRGLIPDSVLDRQSFERRREWWKSVMNEYSQQVLVAEENNQIIGFTYFGDAREKDLGYRGELYAIYLLIDYQKKGIGRLLFMASVQGFLKFGIENMYLWVLSTNPARLFYEKMGGAFLKNKPEKFGDVTLNESAFGWNDLRSLAEMK